MDAVSERASANRCVGTSEGLEIDPQPGVKFPPQVLAESFQELMKFLSTAATQGPIDIECVHQLRVWSRRTIAGLRFYAPLLPPDLNRNLKRRIKQIRTASGTARDCDVMLEKFRLEGSKKWRKKKRCQKANQGDLGPLVNSLQVEREKAQIALADLSRRIIERQRINLKFQQAFDCLSEQTDQWTAKFYRQWAQCRLFYFTDQFFKPTVDRTFDLQSLHRFRLQIKKIRYTIELVAGLTDPDSTMEILHEFSQLQEHLGHVNDLAVLIDRLKQDQAIRRSNQQKKNKWMIKARQKELKIQMQKLHAFISPHKLRRIKLGLDQLLDVPKN